MTDWPAYFAQNRANRLTIPWARGVTVAAALRAPFIRSLQRFQLGERGDGAHLRRVAAGTGDPAYIAAVACFVAEEQEHAALMARLLAALDAPLLDRHWSDGAFRFLCAFAGLRVELCVILIAELIAKRYFRVLHDGIPDPIMRVTCAQILRDEEGHIAFHCAALRPALAGLSAPLHGLIRVGWRAAFRAVCLVVLWDHRALLGALGVAPGAFWRACGRSFDSAAARVFARPAAHTAPARRYAPAQPERGRG